MKAVSLPSTKGKGESNALLFEIWVLFIFCDLTISYLKLDSLVKSQFRDGNVKSSRSRRANSEECSVLSCT